MIPLQEARAHVLGACTALAPVTVALADGLGRVVTEGLVATESVPPFANTAMDGFAVRAADTAGATAADPVTLRVVGTVLAGMAAVEGVGPGEAIRIMTGAPMPPRADAVVIVEHTAMRDDDVVALDAAVEVGESVRPAGDDLAPGDVVFGPGSVLSAGRLGALATFGRTEVRVVPAPRVGVMSTGDELVEGPVALAPGQIRDSNRPSLLALVRQAGCEPVDLGCIADDDAAIAEAITAGVRDCDALITSGGVSMGDVDLVKVVLDRVGDMRWMQVAIRPAKPLAFGTVAGPGGRRVPVFGLPGNPVSSVVSFELFARPGLRRMMGHGDADLDRPRVAAVADEALRRTADGKTHFARVVASYADDGRVHVRSAGGQGSHHLSALVGANGLAELADGPGVEPGGSVDVLLTDHL